MKIGGTLLNGTYRYTISVLAIDLAALLLDFSLEPFFQADHVNRYIQESAGPLSALSASVFITTVFVKHRASTITLIATC